MDGIYDLGGSYEGKIYGLPISGVDFAGMFYNEDIFNELGVKVPTNYDELFDACQQIKDSEKILFQFMKWANRVVRCKHFL